MSLLYNIAKHLINVLESRGEDTSSLTKGTKYNEIDNLRKDLLQTQGALAVARAEIIQVQSQLLGAIEAPLFSLVTQQADGWEKTTITKVWLDNFREIQNKAKTHQDCTRAFEEAYYKLESAQKSIGK